MACGPSMSSGTRERQKEARKALSKDIDEALENFEKMLDDITTKHGRSKDHVHTLVGIAGHKKYTKGPTTKYGVFCGKKLQEENEGKEMGYMTTLPNFLKAHSQELSAEFHALSDDEKTALLSDYLEAKEEKENAPKKISNISLSKIIDFRIRHITSTCQELNRLYKTESLVLFSRGNLAHTYGSASYASPGARNWLASAEIGHNTPDHAAMQLEGFAVSGCTESIEKTQSGSEPAKARYRVIRTACRDMIQDGLEKILKLKKHPRTDVKMNYNQYEQQIVKRLGVALIGWPLHGNVCQPGKLIVDDALVLRHALASKTCKWVILTEGQQEATSQMN